MPCVKAEGAQHMQQRLPDLPNTQLDALRICCTEGHVQAVCDINHLCLT